MRGTDFFTSYQPSTDATKVVTFEGQVQFGSAGPNGSIKNPVFVGPGQTSGLAGGGVAAPPMAVPKNELRNEDRSSNAERAPASSGGFSAVTSEDLPQGEAKRDPNSTAKNGGGAGPEGEDNGGCDTCPPPPPPVQKREPDACPTCKDIVQGGTRALQIKINNTTNP